MSGPLVLCYHALSERWPAALSTTPARFESQLHTLARMGYNGATFTDVAEGRATGKAVAITFDDAYTSVLELGLPILERAGMPATVFAPTSYVGQEQPMTWPGIEQWLGTPHEGELTCMGWDQLRRLREAGWEVGSHTRSHPRLTSLGDADLRDELARSRADCEEGMGAPCTSIAYPYGDHDERVVAAAGEAGYVAACTLPAVLHEPRPLAWPRTGVYHVDAGWRFRLKASPLMRRVRSGPLWRLLRR